MNIQMHVAILKLLGQLSELAEKTIQLIDRKLGE